MSTVEILRAIALADGHQADVTGAALQAAGRRGGRERIVRLIEQGYVRGRHILDEVGAVQYISIQGLTAEGMKHLAAATAEELGDIERQALVALRAGPVSESQLSRLSGTRQIEAAQAIESLRQSSLIAHDRFEPTDLGREVLNRLTSPMASGSTVIIGSVSGSQIASGASAITGNVDQSIHITSDMTRLAQVAEQIALMIDDLHLPSEELEELRADLETIKAQAASARPKHDVISACIAGVKAILGGVTGNAAYDGLRALLQRLVL